MLNTKFVMQGREGLMLLLIGAHCDDIEIGCGGTLLKLLEEYEVSKVTWIVFTSNERRKAEARSSANKFLKSVTNTDIQILDYRDGYLQASWSSVKDRFESIKERTDPDIIFTHYRDDLHQDHRMVNELTWNTFRNHLIYEYEIVKYDGDLGSPNCFVTLNDEQISRKKSIIIDSFKSQLKKQWFDDILLTSIMRIRGAECAAETKYAEAFYSRKMVV